MNNKKIIKFMIPLMTALVIFIPIETYARKKEINKDNVRLVSDVKEFDKAGTYITEVETKDENGEAITELARIHVKYPKTNLNFNQEEGIDAHDILVKTGTFDKTNTSNIIELGHAHAWSLDTGKEILPVHVEVKEPYPFTGTVNHVRYYTNNETDVEVNVFEQDHIYLNLRELYMSQFPILNNSFRTLSLLVLAISILPLLIYGGMIRYIKTKSEKINKLLND